MKKSLLTGFFFCILMGCQHEKNVLPDYPGWYALKVPEANAIEAVYGNIDSTLILATITTIFRTTNRGKSWTEVKREDVSHGILSLASVRDTIFALDGMTVREDTTIARNHVYYGSDPYLYSVDGGQSWKLFPLNNRKLSVPTNELKTPSGRIYTIDELLTPQMPGSWYRETVGIRVSDGRQLSLPNRQQIRSIYFDSRNRLYVAGSAAVCGGLKDFHFCGDENGVLYVSKQPQP